MNTQEPERYCSHQDVGSTLDVVDIWPTIQGEGPYAGVPATFIRLAGCNIQCPLCDTDYTSNRKRMSVDEIVKKTSSSLVVITGGEPFRQPIVPLIRALCYSARLVQIETNGTLLHPSIKLEDLRSFRHQLTIVCSPKTPKVSRDLAPFVSAVKYIVKAGEVDPEDGLPTRSLDFSSAPARPSQFPSVHSLTVYVQPTDEQDDKKNEENVKAAVDSCMRFGYRLCLQTHKIIGLP